MTSPKVKVGEVYEYQGSTGSPDMNVVFVVASEEPDGFVIVPLAMEAKAVSVLTFFRFVVGQPRLMPRSSAWVRDPQKLTKLT